MSDIVNKLWGFCHILRHDGIDYGDYIEQLTYLLFLKMADEKGVPIPDEYSWSVLKEKAGTDLTDYYIELLRNLGKQRGMLGDIYAGAISRFSNPVNLKRLINLIDEVEWTELGVDVKAQAYEGLLEKAASEGKKGAGQYFTPRILIQSIVRCTKPDPRQHKKHTIHDPAAGTGGFLICAFEWLMGVSGGRMEREEAKKIIKETYSGTELVPRPRKLALMNLYLHGLQGEIYLGDSIYEPDRGKRYDCVLTNPPFGTKGANQAPTRDDFTVSTSNKQLNFIQHLMTILKPGGRTAIVLPDNVLFEEHAARDVFKYLMEDCNLHTILRLPRGTFTPYSPGVKANVIFFQKGPKTQEVWIYDARTNIPGITKKERPLSPEHFADFEKCYGKNPDGLSKRIETERFHKFTREEIAKRGDNLDIFWLKDESLEDSDELPEPEDLISDAQESLQTAIDELQDIMFTLQERNEENKE